MRRKFIIATLLSFIFVGTATASIPDRIETFAQAIAKAEGFYQKGTIPNRYHNPGDLKVRRGVYIGQLRVGKAGHVVFKSDVDGWTALKGQIQKIIDGESHVYDLSMSLNDVARRYAGDSQVWGRNVAKTLGVPVETTLDELLIDHEETDCDFRVDVI